jgi:hypothetical protein
MHLTISKNSAGLPLSGEIILRHQGKDWDSFNPITLKRSEPKEPPQQQSMFL